MLTMTCNACGEPIAKGCEHYGVDHVKPPVMHVWDPDDEATHELPEIQLETVLELGNAHEFHFCSTSCLTSWAMGQALDGGGET